MPGTTSTALPSFSHDQHHQTDAAKWKGGGLTKINSMKAGITNDNVIIHDSVITTNNVIT